MKSFLVVTFLLIFLIEIEYSDGLRCWVCGGNSKPYSTNPNEQQQQRPRGDRKGHKRKNETQDVDDVDNDDDGEGGKGEGGKRLQRRGRSRGRDDDEEEGNGNGGRASSRKKEKENQEIASPGFCTSSVLNMTCKPQFPGQRLLCFKEKWTIDGETRVKRGCAVEDKRYNGSGCEEQISTPGSFDVLLCLCKDPLCNGSRMLKKDKCLVGTLIFIGVTIWKYFTTFWPE